MWIHSRRGANCFGYNRSFSSNWDDSNGAQIDCERLPFLNDSKPIKSGDYTKDNNGKYSGETKFCNLLAEAMGVNNPSCNDEVYSFNSANSADFNSKFNSNITFTTKNGMQWYVTQPTKRDVDQDNNKATYQKDIYVDINGSKGPNCIYKATSCEKPDRFKFEVFADGESATPKNGNNDENIADYSENIYVTLFRYTSTMAADIVNINIDGDCKPSNGGSW